MFSIFPRALTPLTKCSFATWSNKAISLNTSSKMFRWKLWKSNCGVATRSTHPSYICQLNRDRAETDCWFWLRHNIEATTSSRFAFCIWIKLQILSAKTIWTIKLGNHIFFPVSTCLWVVGWFKWQFYYGCLTFSLVVLWCITIEPG